MILLRSAGVALGSLQIAITLVTVAGRGGILAM
jgi:hypothetical protein